MLRESTLTANGMKLNVATHTHQARPLLLLHGVMRCWQDFSNLLPALTGRFHVSALDFRGHGFSSRAAAYRVIDYVDDAVAVLETFSSPALLYGHSLGAMVALAAAARVPDRVSAVILEDPPFHTMGERIRATVYHGLFTQMQALARTGGMPDTLAARLADIELSAPGKDPVRLGAVRDAASLAFSARALARLDPEVLTPLIAGQWLDGYDMLSLCPKVNCPALLLQADEHCGGALTEADALQLAGALRNCKRVPFKGCSHLLHQEHADAVLQKVNSFVEGFAKS